MPAGVFRRLQDRPPRLRQPREHRLEGRLVRGALEIHAEIDAGRRRFRDVRLEMVYGSAVHDSPCVDVSPANSIHHRILRLIQYYDTTDPSGGAAAFLTADKSELNYSKIAFGGWSQGGGHAGLIARDHLVARTVYASQGAGQVYCEALHPSATQLCDLDGDGMLTAGNEDELLTAPPWTLQPRVTPGTRQFGAVHRGEKAWAFAPEAFENFGMGKKGTEVDIDAVGADYAAYGCKHIFSTNAPPACEATKLHESMAIDVCMAKDASGLPILAPFYYYALKVPVP